MKILSRVKRNSAKQKYCLNKPSSSLTIVISRKIFKLTSKKQKKPKEFSLQENATIC